MSERPFEQTAAALLVKYHRFVFRQARRAMPFPDLAEDVAQQTFVDFLAKADQWDLDRDLRPLLMTMVQRCARSVWRDRAKLLPESLQQIGEYVQKELSEIPMEADDDRLSALRRCMQKLPEGGRQLISRYYFDGVATKQIAEELSKKADAVGKAIYRLREKLRLCIEQTMKTEAHYG